MTDAAVIEHIARLPHGKANFKSLVRELRAKGASRVELELALARLAARGELVELRAGQYVAISKTRDFAGGRIHMHRDGYGFLIPDRRIEGVKGDIYIPPASASQAMHGDRVLVRIARFEPDGRAD